MHLILDPKSIADQPWQYFQALFPEQATARLPAGQRNQCATQVFTYIERNLIDPGSAVILKRWAYAGQQISEFVVRPDPDVLASNEETVSLALICRFNAETKMMEVIRPAFVEGPLHPDLEFIFEGALSLRSTYSSASSDPDAIEFLNCLPEAGADIHEALRKWSKYLEWRQKLAEEKANIAYAYSEFQKADQGTAISFYLTEEAVREKLRKRFIGESLRATATEDAKARGLFQGEFRRIETVGGVKDAVLGRGNFHLRNKSDPSAPAEKQIITLAIPAESDAATPFSFSAIPSPGFLRPAMEGELAAVDIQLNGLQRLAEFRGQNPNLRDWLFDIRKALPCDQSLPTDWTPDQSLNAKQRECVAKSLCFEDLLLLWGPPGTGKTTVISEISSQICRRGGRILISSQANLAVDQALEKLPLLPHIRPARVSTSKKKEGLGIESRTWINRWLDSIGKASAKAAAKEVDPAWKTLLGDWAKHIGTEAGKSITPEFERHYLRQANVIGATCLETGKPEFRSNVRFDSRFSVAVVDEVSKATPPELLLPALLGQRTILVGDHRQLPPVFKDATFPEAVENGVLAESVFDEFRDMVTTSLFESYFRMSDPSIQCALDEQYRMHPHIMDAVNLFYADRPLVAGGGRDHRARERAHDIRLQDQSGRPWLKPGKHLVWIDTSRDERGQLVHDEKVGTSRRNDIEMRVCGRLLPDLLGANLTVGLISFYRAQIQAIGKHLWDTRENRLLDFVDEGGVNTVDQFQGSERDVIIVSLARTDQPLTGEFVSDFRRINVALSRAKRLLIILGSGPTFDSGPVRVPKADRTGDESIHAYRLIREMAGSIGVQLSTAAILGIAAQHSNPRPKPQQQPFNPAWQNSRQSK